MVTYVEMLDPLTSKFLFQKKYQVIFLEPKWMVKVRPKWHLAFRFLSESPWNLSNCQNLYNQVVGWCSWTMQRLWVLTLGSQKNKQKTIFTSFTHHYYQFTIVRKRYMHIFKHLSNQSIWLYVAETLFLGLWLIFIFLFFVL